MGLDCPEPFWYNTTMSKKKKKKTDVLPEYEVYTEPLTLDTEIEHYMDRLNNSRIIALEETVVYQAKRIMQLEARIQAMNEWAEQDAIFRKHDKKPPISY